jgi:benzodiazapine receptor
MSIILKIIICVVVCVGLGTLSGLNTIDAIQTWYPTIQKPSWNPPNWLFGPVWTCYTSMMGISFALLWNSSQNGRKSAMLLFVVQFGLNMAWSFIFFNLHLLGWSFIESLMYAFCHWSNYLLELFCECNSSLLAHSVFFVGEFREHIERNSMVVEQIDKRFSMKLYEHN